MLEGINEIAVVVSTLLALAVGSVWYSPLLFGMPWMRAIGVDPNAEAEAERRDMPKLVMIAGSINIVLMIALAVLVRVADASGYGVYALGGIVAILIGLMYAGNALWERKPLSYLLINVGYMLVVVFGGLTIISRWPW